MSERLAGRLLSTTAHWQRATQVVIIGSGAAGLAAALHLAAARVPTMLITRGGLRDSNTAWAQGGLAAVWAADDSTDLHHDDTLQAGAGLCDPVAVRELVDEAPEAIVRLIAMGAQFDRSADDYDLHLEGGHQRRRVLHAGDYSGAEVITTLVTALHRAVLQPEPSLSICEDLRALDVLTDASGAACGVRVLASDGSVGDIAAPSVVLATGGLGQLFQGTSNPLGATGDGIAMAWRAGALLRDLEFVQFHPTVLAVSSAQRGVLISEAVRGEGAVLIDHTGAHVMAHQHPLADLAPRDVVSAAMQAHVARTGEPHLFLDGTHLGEQMWREHFPTILTMCREHGVDPVTEPIPVQPGAHYSCGGIAADLSGRTSVPGLYAVGEVAATGVHGANRLASNSVPEALIAGHRVGVLLTSEAPVAGRPQLGSHVPLAPASITTDLQHTMSLGAAMHRTAASLATTSQWLANVPTVHTLDHGSVNATNMVTVASLLTHAAAARTESRGTHRRSDYPATSAHWEQHITLLRGPDGELVRTPDTPLETTETEAA